MISFIMDDFYKEYVYPIEILQHRVSTIGLNPHSFVTRSVRLGNMSLEYFLSTGKILRISVLKWSSFIYTRFVLPGKKNLYS